MTTKIKCPVCGKYFESQYVTPRYCKGVRGTVMCDLCYDHCVDYGEHDDDRTDEE